jgi:hypothetical protein
VPVEHRFLGLDRRSLLPGLVVIGLLVLWTVVIPAVDDALSYDQQTRAGDVFLLGPGLTMNAQPGWGVESGVLTSDDRLTRQGAPVALTNGGVSLVVVPGPFSGSASALLSSIERVDRALRGDEAFHVSSDVATFHTNQGTRGVAQGYTTISGTGVVTALVYGDTGLKITFTGSSAAMAAQGEAVGAMIDSIRFDTEAAR